MTLLLLAVLATATPAGATHDLEVIASGSGGKGWVAIKFYTDGGDNDPEPIRPPNFYEAGQIRLWANYTARSTNPHMKSAVVAPLLRDDGTLYHFPILAYAHRSNGEVRIEADHRSPVPAHVEAGVNPTRDVNGIPEEWSYDSFTGYYHYPKERGTYTALIFVAGDVVSWDWHFAARPGNNVKILQVNSGEGGTYFFDGADMRGTRAGAEVPGAPPYVQYGRAGALVESTATVDARHKLYGLVLGSDTLTKLHVDTPNESYDCDNKCWFSHVSDAGRTTVTATGVSTTTALLTAPTILFADADLPG